MTKEKNIVTSNLCIDRTSGQINTCYLVINVGFYLNRKKKK